jgi:mannose/fructose/N-acetylgalactosamine-specific phosphotransferase system component IIB
MKALSSSNFHEVGSSYMKIVLVRVDDRLIHGQVAIGWTRTVGATHIVVANDEVAKDNTQKMLMKMATPVGVKLTVLSVAEAAAELSAGKFGNDRVMVLVRDPQSLLALMEGGVKLEKVNVGNVRMAEGRVRLTKEVAATPEEIEVWNKLDSAGVELEAMWIPGGDATNLNEIVRAYK